MDELKVLSAHGFDISAIENAQWLEVRQAQNLLEINKLATVLDPGESEAIVLAIELGADYLLIDERKGRKTAKEHGIKIIGLLGIVLEAKMAGLIAEARPIVDALTQQANFRVDKSLYREILALAGE